MGEVSACDSSEARWFGAPWVVAQHRMAWVTRRAEGGPPAMFFSIGGRGWRVLPRWARCLRGVVVCAPDGMSHSGVVARMSQRFQDDWML